MKKSRFYHTAPRMKVEAFVDLSKDKINFGKIIKNYPRYTICGSLDYDTNLLSFGIACCSGKDVYNKKIGRRISEGRALKTPIVTVSVTKENISEVFITTAKQIEKELYQND